MNNIKIGIDFGTTNSSIAYMKYNNFRDEFTPDCFSFRGKSYVKTLITYNDDENYWIGDDALNKAADYPNGFIKSIKRKIVNNEDLHNKYVAKSEIDIIADILRHLKDQLTSQLPLDTVIDGVVMGMPIGFSDKGKNIYLQALVKAGFYPDLGSAYRKSVFVSEPIAAVLDYNLSLSDDKKVMVFDFGGGTLDLVIMQMRNILYGNEIKEHEVIAKGGQMKFGGDDFDRIVLEDIVADKVGIRKLKRDLGITNFDDILSVRDGIELMKEIQRAKEELTRVKITDISLLNKNFDINIKITRDEFELAIRPYMAKIKDGITNCLKSANNGIGMAAEDIDIVILSGGSSLIPLVQETLSEIFGRNKVKVHGDAMTSISRGLALRGFNYNKSRYSDILEHSYGIKMLDERNINEIISPILKKGQSIKDINSSECYEEFEINPNSKKKNYFSVRVCEDNSEIGEAIIPQDRLLMADSKYKIFFVIHDDLKKIELQIVDTTRGQKVDIPINSKFISINEKGVL